MPTVKRQRKSRGKRLFDIRVFQSKIKCNDKVGFVESNDTERSLKLSKLHNMRIVEIQRFRAVSSGTHNLNELFGPGSQFSAWVDNHKNLLSRHPYEPSDFLWHENRNIDTSVWVYAIKDDVTAEDTAPFEIIDFPGGIYLVATGDEMNSDDLNETIDCMMTWINHNEVFEYGDFPLSGMCNMPNPQGSADSALGISQQQIFLPLKLRNK